MATKLLHHSSLRHPLLSRSRWRIAILALLGVVCIWSTPVEAADHLPGYYIDRAEQYIRTNAWQAAKREIDEGLEIYGDNAQLRYLNGSYYYKAGRLQEARYNLSRALQEDDQHFHARRLLVDVEDELQHYSSAICYINELLEFQPYDRDLWRRKINLYRKLGNQVEADAALQRLAHIYPNDSIVRKDVINHNRENWNQVLKKSSLSEAAENLELWLDMDPKNLSYYEELISVYERMGEYEHALGTANRGLIHYPQNPVLMKKAVGIMTNLGLYAQALAFLKSNGVSEHAYGGLLQEMADDARLRDPYEANGRLFAVTQDRDALTYLINTALTRGYNADARQYIMDAMELDGRTTKLLMKLYTLEQKEGNKGAQLRILQELAELNPEDDELMVNYGELMMELGVQDMATLQWKDAYDHLNSALKYLSSDHESWPALVSRQITVLGRLGRYDEAIELYHEASATAPDYSKRFISAYEDVVANHLRGLIEEENYEEAFAEAQQLLELNPKSEVALRTCINMSQTLKHNNQFHEYAQMGYDRHPETSYFIIKQAVSLQEQGKVTEALGLIHRQYDGSTWINPQLTTAYSGIAHDWALQLMKRKANTLAMQVLDDALARDPDNAELLYCKGLIYENMKDYVQAYQYQNRNYEPSNAEQKEFYEHMRFLQFRGFRNRIDASYTRAIYNSTSESLASTGHLYSIASVSYSRLTRRDTYMAQVSYKGIDGYHEGSIDEPGGTGLEFMAQWDHTFDANWSMMANVAVSTQFFNKVGCNISANYAFSSGWTPGLRVGYRRTPETYLFLSEGQQAVGKFHLFLFTPSLEKAWERISVTANVDLITMQSSLYYNVGLKGKFLINDDNTSSVTLLAGFGSFPELTFFEQTALRNLSHTNAMVGFDAQYLLTRHLSVGLTGNWNTCFNPYTRKDGTLADSYRNIYSLNAQLHVAF